MAILLWLSLAAGLAACDQVAVEVAFTEPFPAGAPNLAGFAPRHQGCYLAASDTIEALLLGHQQLVRQQWRSWPLTGRQLDSLGLPSRAGWARLLGQPYRVQPLAADSFRLSWREADTLLAVGPGRPGQLRYFQGWYYLSQPDPAAPGCWQVQRLAVAGRHLIWQALSPDSLRLRTLDPAALALRREPHTLHFVLSPGTGRARQQLSRYTGLWQTLGEYRRR